MSPRLPLSLALTTLFLGCSRDAAAPAPAAAPTAARQQSDLPPLDPDNIVSIAVASKDHTTLVAALKAANYVTSVANPGPLTVFAPTDAAFAALPPGTVDGLLQPERVDDLKNGLKYHVAPATFEIGALKDGMELGMANGQRARIRHDAGKVRIGDATIVASIRASNGVVHVVDRVLLPPVK